ncbi:cytochrome oxidase subunit III [Mucilaginibacter corticis]|uniref:Cytochrome oxidase subunit III n=1 Tax=Mucilaginibacter corticis TaxID=2597670 RepID=A0A556MS95_9SPHI|nr:cytochrome c oxidase subunit 3 [Mucilaginibacter corticis]TSJ42783.1 cytochrome oxidase subunit III [Mucilaginibacter corticis]
MSATVTQIDELKTTPWSGGRSPFNVEYGKMMMWFFLLSDAFTFSSLLISYGALRFSASTWPIASEVFQSVPGTSIEHGAPLVFVGLMTFILILSSVTMVLAVEAGHRMARKEVVWWMIATVIGGFMFLGCQALEWNHLHSEGFWWSAIPNAETLKEFFDPKNLPALAQQQMTAHQFANLFFTITGFHGFHVFSGVIINIIITLNVLAGTYEKRGSYLMIEKVGLYWHFVDLVWVFVFTFFYLV